MLAKASGFPSVSVTRPVTTCAWIETAQTKEERATDGEVDGAWAVVHFAVLAAVRHLVNLAVAVGVQDVVDAEARRKCPFQPRLVHAGRHKPVLARGVRTVKVAGGVEVDVEEGIPRVVDLEHVLYAAAKIGAAHVEAACRPVERGEELAQPEADFGCPKSERGLRVDAELNGVDVPDVFALGEQDVRTAGIGLVHQGVIVLHGGVVRREGEPSPRCEERDVLHLLRAERGVARAVGEAVFVGQLVAQV